MNFTLLAAYSLSVVTLLLTPGPVVALITTTAAQRLSPGFSHADWH